MEIPIESTGDARIDIVLASGAIMTPYDTDVPPAPIAKYLRTGWRGRRAMMRPRGTGAYLARTLASNNLLQPLGISMFYDFMKTPVTTGHGPNMKTIVR